MSERIDRRIGNNRLLLITVVLFLCAGFAAVYAWLSLPGPSAVVPEASPPAAQTLLSDEPVDVMLYVPGLELLSPSPAAVKRHADTQAQARELLSAAFTEMRALRSPIVKDLELRAFFLDNGGTAYVDLSQTLENRIKASAGEEFLAIYSIVNMLTTNFDEIKQVRFLVEGRESQTLAGHIDLSRNFTKRMDLVKQ